VAGSSLRRELDKTREKSQRIGIDKMCDAADLSDLTSFWNFRGRDGSENDDKSSDI
jgi:hypothetical protein